MKLMSFPLMESAMQFGTLKVRRSMSLIMMSCASRLFKSKLKI